MVVVGHGEGDVGCLAPPELGTGAALRLGQPWPEPSVSTPVTPAPTTKPTPRSPTCVNTPPPPTPAPPGTDLVLGYEVKTRP